MKRILTIIGIVILLIILCLFALKFYGDRKIGEENKTTKNPCTEAEMRADSLQKALNKCLGIPEPMTVEEQLAKVIAELDVIKKMPKGKTIIITEKKPDTNPIYGDVSEESFTNNEFTRKANNNSSLTTTIETFDPDNGNLPITLYQGKVTGDWGVTIDGTGHSLYFIKNSVFMSGNPTIPAPRVRGVNGPEMTLDNSTGYLFWVDQSRLVSVQEINNYKYAIEWNIYIGETNYGTGTYETWLPHQVLKPLINKVRGKEWGEITDQDLIKMNAENSNIWTPQNEGTIRPFRLNNEGGRAIGREDQNLYQGWNFRNRIYAEKKTTIQ